MTKQAHNPDVAPSPSSHVSAQPGVPAGQLPPSQPVGTPPIHDNIASALSAAQGEIVNPAKGAENPHFKSRYANLVDGLRAIKQPLAKHGIAVTQLTYVEGDLLMLETKLIHVSGESLEADWPVANWTKSTPQQMGSALTYARRYSLFSLVGIAGDDDDDGEAASVMPIGNAKDPVIGGDELAHLYSLLSETDTDPVLFLKAMDHVDISQLRMSQYKRAVGIFNRKLQTQAAMAKAKPQEQTHE